MDKIAVLASGGLDSAVLIVDKAKSNEVFPLYVRWGLSWEEDEYQSLLTFLEALKLDYVRHVSVLSIPIHSVYNPDHWSMQGKMPRYEEPEKALFLPGRNILLLGLASIWCYNHHISRIAMGLQGEKLPDATPEFLEDFSKLLGVGLDFPITIEAPFINLEKDDLIRSHPNLPFEFTITCLEPKGRLHCGRCRKCRERQEGFINAGVPDKTQYRIRL